MRRLVLLCCLSTIGCGPRELAAQSNVSMYPGNFVGVAWATEDLRARVSARQIRLLMSTPTGESPPAALFEAIADAVTVRQPDGRDAPLAFDLTRAAYRETLESAYPDPPEARITVGGNHFESGWYEAMVDLSKLNSVAAGYKLNVVAGRIDSHVVDDRYVVSRFSHGSRPVVRQVIICEASSTEVAVDLSERARLAMPAIDALKLLTESGSPIPGCPMSAEAVVLDGTEHIFYYSCERGTRLPGTVRVLLTLGGTLSAETREPFLSVSGSAFDEVITTANLLSDGSCGYFVPL